MRKPAFVAQAIAIAISLLAVTPACAQNFPNRPVRIVTAEPGGGPDVVGRLMTRPLSVSLGQQVLVDNQPGANGVIAAQAVLKAPADGHTVLLYSGAFWSFPLLQKVPYDPVQDFVPVTIAASSPNLIVVHPSLPVKSLRELIALAKARPGQLNYASGGLGSANHLAAELFKAMAGVDIVRIAYKGGADAQSDLVAGRVELTFASGAIVAPLLKSGRVKVLAVTSSKPSTLYPGLPTASASGVEGYESISRFNVFAPARTPDAAVRVLNRDMVQALNLADVKTKLFEAGTEVVASSPEELASVMKIEMTRLGKIIRNIGVKPE